MITSLPLFHDHIIILVILTVYILGRFSPAILQALKKNGKNLHLAAELLWINSYWKRAILVSYA